MISQRLVQRDQAEETANLGRECDNMVPNQYSKPYESNVLQRIPAQHTFTLLLSSTYNRNPPIISSSKSVYMSR